MSMCEKFYISEFTLFIIIHKYVFFLLYNDLIDEGVYLMINDSTTWHYPINLKLKILNKNTPRVQVLSYIRQVLVRSSITL